MDKDTKINAEQTASKQRAATGVPFVKGDPRINREGRPPGAESFATKWRKAVEKIAEMNNTTADDIEQQLLLVGYKKAKDGDYRFWGDVHDRVYGKPLQKNEHTGANGEPLRIEVSEALLNKHNDTDSSAK